MVQPWVLGRSTPLHSWPNQFAVCLPQTCPYGLYAEQLSGTPFTAPRRCCTDLSVQTVVDQRCMSCGPAYIQEEPAPQRACRTCAQVFPATSHTPAGWLGNASTCNLQGESPQLAVPHPPLSHPPALPPPPVSGGDSDGRLFSGRSDAQPAALAAVPGAGGPRGFCEGAFHGVRQWQVGCWAVDWVSDSPPDGGSVWEGSEVLWPERAGLAGYCCQSLGRGGELARLGQARRPSMKAKHGLSI